VTATQPKQHDSTALLPDAGMLRVGPAPHWHVMPGILQLTASFALAAAALAVSGLALFGWYTVRVLAISVGVALLVESALNTIKGSSSSWSESHALLIGLLFGCTLPPMVSWRVVAVGAAVAVLVGQTLAGGIGNYLWHPVALARVTVQILFASDMNPARWPVLAPEHLFWGSLDRAEPLPALSTWATATPSSPGVQAWLMPSVERLLCEPLTATESQPASAIAAFVRDQAPPWWDTLTGVAGGAIGEASVAAALAVACLLAWRGLLRWPMVFAAIGAAAFTACIFPVRTHATGAPVALCPLPGFAFWNGLPVGAAYVLYQMTAGGFPFVVLLLASDPASSPLASRGHALFGAIIGCATILLRVGLGVPAAVYWALLIANTLVPAIDRMTRRRVLGT